jgi:hypothetical protein
VGKGVGIDPLKAIHHNEQAAIRGCREAMQMLAIFEHVAGNFERSEKREKAAAMN